jgi:hypothetical protein
VRRSFLHKMKNGCEASSAAAQVLALTVQPGYSSFGQALSSICGVRCLHESHTSNIMPTEPMTIAPLCQPSRRRSCPVDLRCVNVHTVLVLLSYLLGLCACLNCSETYIIRTSIVTIRQNSGDELPVKTSYIQVFVPHLCCKSRESSSHTRREPYLVAIYLSIYLSIYRRTHYRAGPPVSKDP